MIFRPTADNSSGERIGTNSGRLEGRRIRLNSLDELVARADLEKGIYLKELPLGAELEVETRNHCYHIVNLGGGKARLSGHPEFCPTPVTGTIRGSTWGGSALKQGFLGHGMHLEFALPSRMVLTTSPIVNIRRADV